jgi:hypothetical protein
MSPVISGNRLTQLRALRARIDAEITVLERGERLLAARRATDARTDARARAAGRKLRQDADRARIEALAPPADVRAWARAHGVEIGTFGRISLDLRRAYLAAHDIEVAS